MKRPTHPRVGITPEARAWLGFRWIPAFLAPLSSYCLVACRRRVPPAVLEVAARRAGRPRPSQRLCVSILVATHAVAHAFELAIRRLEHSAAAFSDTVVID